nr:hypothetical protein GCM10020092_104690 [Actinoplanes digitatis]
MGGTARVCVRVDAAWRVHVLVDELVARGLVVNWAPVTGEERDEPVAELTAEPVEQTMAADPQDVPAAEPVAADPPDAPMPERPVEDLAEAPVGKKENAEPRTVAFEVRTAFSSRLNALARAWPPAADKLFLGGPRLRLWVAAAGEPRPQGYALGLDPDGFS